MKKTIFIITIFLFLSNNIFAQTKKTTNQDSQTIFSKSYDYVNDYEKILTPSQITGLTNTLKSSEKNSGHKIIIVTTSSIKPYANIPEYALYLNTYLNNKLKMNAAVLIVLSKDLRQIQLQASDQIGNKLNYDETREIISNYALPEFKKGDFHKGLEKAVAQIIVKLK